MAVSQGEVGGILANIFIRFFFQTKEVHFMSLMGVRRGLRLFRSEEYKHIETL